MRWSPPRWLSGPLTQSARLRHPPRSQPLGANATVHMNGLRAGRASRPRIDMPGQTDRRCQSAHGLANSAWMPPRDAETTAPAAPQAGPIRTRRRRAREGRARILPRVGGGEVLEDLPVDGVIVQRGDQAQAAPTLETRQHVDAKGSFRVVVPLRNDKISAKSAGASGWRDGVSVAELSERIRREMVGRDGIEPPTPGFSVLNLNRRHLSPSQLVATSKCTVAVVQCCGQ